MKITRRAMAAVLASAGTRAQTPAHPEPVVELPGVPDAELRSAREQVRANIAVLLQFEISISAEPAFQFKA